MTPRPSAIVETTVSATSGARRNVRSAKLHVARERLEEGDPALVAALVGGERHGAEACARAPARLRGAQAVRP